MKSGNAHVSWGYALTTDKVIATGLLGIASYGLESTRVSGLKWFLKPHGPVATIVVMLFYLLFINISIYSVLTTLGYLHKG